MRTLNTLRLTLSRLSKRDRTRETSQRSICTSTMHSFLEVIGPGTPDASATLQLFFDESRYLFDCGDGTQRLCTEHSIKLGKLRAIHLTSLAAPSIGGLLGLGLTLADAGKDGVMISAPEGLKSLFRAAKPFYHRPAFTASITEIPLRAQSDPSPVVVVDDAQVVIRALPIRTQQDRVNASGFGEHDALAYICQLRDLRGKFNPQRAMELGVKKGRNFGLLQKGNAITTDDGKVVQPEDVMSPSTPGPLALILPCPTIDHVQSITGCKHLQPAELGMVTAAKSLERVCVIVHLAPREVLMHEDYTQWCDKFGKRVTHIPIHPTVTSARTVFRAQAEDLALLHYSIDKEYFPLPADAFDAEANRFSEEACKEVAMSNGAAAGIGKGVQQTLKQKHLTAFLEERAGTWVEPDCRLKFTLSPVASVGLDRNAIRPRFIEQKPGIPSRPWREEALRQTPEPEPAGTEMKTPACISQLAPRTAAVRFFGTGAAIPGKHRNVSSLMIDMFERGGVLMDCGEGTWGQMVRHFGLERARRVLCELKVVFISHMHADHHLGLVTLLHERRHAEEQLEEYRHGPKLVIVGPKHLATWLGACQAATGVYPCENPGHLKRPYNFFDASSLTDPQTPEAKVFQDTFGIELGCVEVIHCPFAFGAVLRDCVHGWKVVYSGDTRPCGALGELGRGATLAIHEATLDDEMEDEALEKAHCTTSEALAVCATQMGAWRTILTHFSQRYPKVPKLNDQVVKQLQKNRAAFAFDLMCVDFSRLEELPGAVPALREAFPDEDVGLSLMETNRNKQV